MKKIIIAVIATVALTALAPLGLQAGVGLKGGLSWSSLTMASTEPLPFTFGNRQDYAGGVFFDIGLGFVTFQPEILYVRMGGQYEADELNSLEFRHQYIQAPLLLRFNIIPSGPVRPFLCAGGYGAYLIRSDGVMEIDGVVEKSDITLDYQRFDYGLVGGAGLQFNLGVVGLSIEGRYVYGLANMLKDPAVGESMKNRSLMALVGIKF